MKNKSIYFGLIFFVAAVFFISSCTEETSPPPTASFTVLVEGNVVSFTSEATDYTKFEWNFNDGSYINTIPNPVHTFPEYGKDFEVTLTVLGDGGEVSVTTVVSIPVMTKMQLLTGGTDAEPGSRKWRINPDAPFFDVTDANENLTSVIPAEFRFGGALGYVGLGQVYVDEFEFKSDGTMSIHSKGGGIFTSLAYVMANSIGTSAMYADLGLAYADSFTNPEAATFILNENKDHTISTPYGPVTYPNVMTLSFDNGGFLGIMDFTTECIVTKINETEMDVVLFYAHPEAGSDPLLAMVISFESI
jgi:PKD repeat protein